MKNNITCLLDTEHTVAKELFENEEYPHKVISHIKEFILRKGNELPKDMYECINGDIWIAKSAKVALSACIEGPCIIDENSEIRHCAYIRGSVIVGKGVVVGNSTEVKNSVLFDNVQVPHFNYIGDSVLGYKVHFGAGSITSNVKNDKTEIFISYDEHKIPSGYNKLGTIVGDNAEIGCGSVLNPGTVIGRNVSIYPLSSVRGEIEENTIYKSEDQIIKKQLNADIIQNTAITE